MFAEVGRGVTPRSAAPHQPSTDASIVLGVAAPPARALASVVAPAVALFPVAVAPPARPVREDQARTEVGQQRDHPADHRSARRDEAPVDADPEPDGLPDDAPRYPPTSPLTASPP